MGRTWKWYRQLDQTKTRQCLRCGRTFESNGLFHCSECWDEQTADFDDHMPKVRRVARHGQMIAGAR